jgi:hypothetical protein
MPTHPNWKLGISAEICDWYLFQCRELPDALQKEIKYQMEYAKVQLEEIKYFQEYLKNYVDTLNYRKRIALTGIVDSSELEEMIENIRSVRARLAWLEKRDWASRYNNLKAQFENMLTSEQETHNYIRNCENSCLTCRYNAEKKDCRSLFGQQEKVGEFRKAVQLEPGKSC